MGDVKQESDVPMLTLTVKDSEGMDLVFKVKPTTKLQKLMDAFCQKRGKDKDQVRFVFDGQIVKGDMTPAQLEMQTNDTIDAMVKQVGGCV